MSFSLSYKYITADELAALLRSEKTSDLRDIAVVDVRDDDFVGGNIVAAMNVPSETFHANVQGLVKKLEGVPKVVFREIYSAVPVAGMPLNHEDCALSQQRGPKAARIYAETRSATLSDGKAAQEIFVLRDGFAGFQSKFRNDPELVEKFNKMYHD